VAITLLLDVLDPCQRGPLAARAHHTAYIHEVTHMTSSSPSFREAAPQDEAPPRP
jgi:hypothetical protein